MTIAAPHRCLCTLTLGLASALTCVAHAQDAAPVVTLTSAAFEAPPLAGELLRFEANVSGGRAPYSYEWDLDGDGAVDRRSAAAMIEASFPTRLSVDVGVQVIDADGRRGVVSRLLRVRGPEILVEKIGPPINDGRVDPGDFIGQTLRFTNVGDAVQPAGYAMFAAGDTLAFPVGPSPNGYSAVIGNADACGYGWIDLVDGQYATPALLTSAAEGSSGGALNDARTAAIDLAGGWVRLYGERYPRAVMSTNGYLSFNVTDSGGDFTPSCDADFSQGASGPQLRPLHDDLIVAGSGDTPEIGAGLRYRHFATCPRTPHSGVIYPCHVFSWTGMRQWNQGNPGARFDFQAVAYEGSHEIAYQYRTPPPDGGLAATIGIVNLDGSEAFNASCRVASVNTGNSTACFSPTAVLPASGGVAQLNYPYLPIAELAVGQSVQTGMGFDLSRSASCNQPYAVDYIGTVSNSTSSFGRFRTSEGRIAESCQPRGGSVPILILPPGQTSFRPRYGQFLNPARPGNGLLNFATRTDQGFNGSPRRDTFGGAWFTALSDRTPVWYTLQGNLVYGVGELIVRRFVNAAAPDGFAPMGEIVGRAWILQLGLDKVVFAWEFDDGSSGIELFSSHNLPSGAPNHTQTWFSPLDPGWGLAIESLQLGTSFEFIGAFVYDAEGRPRWVVGDSNTNTGGSIELTGHRPHCPGCPWIADWSSEGQPAGRLQLGYQGQSAGTLGTTIQLPPPYRGDWMREALPIQPIAQPAQ